MEQSTTPWLAAAAVNSGKRSRRLMLFQLYLKPRDIPPSLLGNISTRYGIIFYTNMYFKDLT